MSIEVKEYKNWGELCEAIGWKVAGGNTKIKQQKELSSICDWTKKGNKIVIKEIYTEPKEIEDKRHNNGGNNTSNYSEIDLLLLNYINKMDKPITITFSRILDMLGMKNNNYIDNVKKISGYSKINIYTVEDIVNSYIKNTRRIIENALDRLKENNNINWCKRYIVVKHNAEGKEVHKLATKEEEGEIKECELYVANVVMQIETVAKALYSNHEKFFKILNETLKKEGICDSCYKVYYITKKENYIKGKRVNSADLRTEINKKIVKSCISSAENRQKIVMLKD